MSVVNIHNSRFSDIQEKAEGVIQHINNLFVSGFALCIACSYGKDSSVCLVLFLEALKRAKANGIEVPTCYVVTSNTGIESPSMDVYVHEMMTMLRSYCKEHNLDVHVVQVEPSLASSFQYATIGRGKLITTAAVSRSCSVDWKVRPSQKWLRETLKSLNGNIKLVTCVGTRYSESQSRKLNMESRQDGPTVLVPQDDSGMYYQNAVIADWDVNDVWELLLACDAKRGGIFSTFTSNFNRTLDLYRDANEGMCVAISPNDESKRASCGSRFGCWNCCISGSSDKSAEAMIATDPLGYSNLVGLAKLRNYFSATYHDHSKRDWFQKELSDVGYVGLSPDYYSADERRRLLRYMISLDVLEEDRAERISAAIATGDIENTEENRRLADPQFQLITPRLLLAINFAWALQSEFESGFQALYEWVDIRIHGRLSHVPHIEPDEYPKKSIPPKRWFYIGTYNHPYGVDGLRNILGEAINQVRKPGRPAFAQYVDKHSGQPRKVTYFAEAEEFEVDPVQANLFLLEFEENYIELYQHNCQSVIAYLLDREIVKIGKGMVSKYDQIARRGQYFQRLRSEVGNVSDHALRNSISSREHDELLEQYVAEENSDQYDLFAAS